MSGSGGGADGGGGGPPRATGYDEWVEALAAGQGFYLACSNGHGSLPPRRVCPDCESRDLSEEPLPEAGEVVTFSELHVAAPAFADETPYVTAIADFGPVRLTGVVRGVDADAVDVGLAVGATATDPREGTDGGSRRRVVFDPR
ncbi:Zn-ribbon domain-containing OB-fold protein [Candidatus Halobonum tyrrellensis]|uniref:ChsH2 C-terminal OB-fold domain-containing protein n=1 Tax=Candidatus Halobonum tyrrellensis G22 TaxID=1324957 RepID=V4HMR4_9EURY|nr:OB-fold domain-containing protein [Candidatus Halobonum tyrrellensis]ESP89219.1 hypothetical protein K933_04356 [Candidatus Halobonum tyrrellensis G22]